MNMLFYNIRRWSTVGVLCLLFSLPLSASGQGLEVAPVQAGPIIRVASEPVTLALRVTNRSGRAGRFSARTELPEGWRVLTALPPLDLAAGASAIRLLGLVIPSDTPAGDYSIVHEEFDPDQPGIRGSHSTTVEVSARFALEARFPLLPEFVVAGESYTLPFVLGNTGNTTVTVDYRLRSSLDNVLLPDSGRLTLAPGEQQTVEVLVRTVDRGRPERDILTLKVDTRDANASVERTVNITILPRSGQGSLFHSVPSALGLGTLLRKDEDGFTSDWQLSLQGQGSFGPDDAHRIAYLLRTPDRPDDAQLGLHEEYRLSYRGPRITADLGDRFYALSPLTEYGRYGRGAELGYRGERFEARAFQMTERLLGTSDELETTPVRETAFSAGYLLADRWRLHFNLLDKDADLTGRIAGLRSELNWNTAFNLDIELARSTGTDGSGTAGRARLYGRHGDFHYLASLYFADPDYIGHHRDGHYGSLDLRYDPSPTWQLRGYARWRRDNLDLDPEQAAPQEQEFSLGVDHRLSNRSRIALDYRLRHRQDRRTIAEFDSTYQGVKLSVDRQWDTLRLNASAEWGRTEDSTQASRSDSQQYQLSAYWQPTRAQSYGLFLSHQSDGFRQALDDRPLLDDRQDRKLLGVQARYRFTERTALAVDAQKTFDGVNDHEVYRLALEHRFANAQRLALTARHSTDAERGSEALLSYTIPFGLPVKRRRDVDTLSGRIHDQATGDGVPGVALSLGDRVAISDSAGRFRFPAVPLGTQYLTLRGGDTLRDKVPVVAVPMPVEIGYRADNRVDIPVTEAATLSGRVVLYQSPTTLLQLPGAGTDPASDTASAIPQTTELTPTGGLSGVLVILRNEQREFRRLTDTEGYFRLTGIPAGQWTLTVDERGLPDYHRPEMEQFQIETRPGAETELELKIIPARRNIRLLDSPRRTLRG